MGCKGEGAGSQAIRGSKGRSPGHEPHRGFDPPLVHELHVAMDARNGGVRFDHGSKDALP